MAAIEPKVYQWMYGVLAGDSQVNAVFGTRVYRKVLPQTAAYDHSLIMQYMGGGTVAPVGSIRIYSNMLFMVKGTGKAGSYSQLRDGMNRVDGLLHRASGDIAGARILWCEHEEEVPLEPVVYSGETYEQIAILYRVRAHEL